MGEDNIITEDMIEEIFLRLPLEPLIRCKCLSKKWNQFISYNTSFRQTYFSILTSAASPLMLGFFFNRRRHYPRVHDKVSFLPTCSEGSKLKSQAPPHPFDESLSFLGHADETVFYIKGVSNGFLLCCLQEYDPMTYYICNPITKNRVALPKPSMTNIVVPTGFICNANPHHPYSLDLLNYKVVRGLWPYSRSTSNTLTIEIFSSQTFKWEVFQMSCPSRFLLELNSPSPSVVINEQGVVHLAVTEAIYHCIIVYDPMQEFLQLVELPGEKHCFYCLGLSDGLTLYARARHDRHELEIFVLQESHDYTKEWSIKHRDSIEHKTLYEKVHWNNNLSIRAFHPLNPLVLFLTVANKLILFDAEKSKMELVCNLPFDDWTYFLFAYVWPTWPPFFP